MTFKTASYLSASNDCNASPTTIVVPPGISLFIAANAISRPIKVRPMARYKHNGTSSLQKRNGGINEQQLSIAINVHGIKMILHISSIILYSRLTVTGTNCKDRPTPPYESSAQKRNALNGINAPIEDVNKCEYLSSKAAYNLCGKEL